MKMKVWFVALCAFMASCKQPQQVGARQEETSDMTVNKESIVNQNLKGECISNFDANIDYFPEKAVIQAASGLEIQYHKSYKVITVKKPYWEASQPLRYVLVQCGAPLPKIEADAVIPIPIRTLATTSTTQLPALAQLGLTKALVGHAGLGYVHTDSVKARIQQGKVKEIGENEMNYEMLATLKPDLLMRYTMGTNDPLAAKLTAIRQNVVINAEYTETSPLGRTEWIKFTSAFFNEEAKATHIFEQIKQRYDALKVLVQQQSERPSAFSGNAFQGTWYISGKNSFVGRFLTDAGANVVFPQEEQSLTLNFEAVLLYGAAAQVWFGTSPYQTQENALAADSRLGLFKSVKDKRYYFYDGALFESAIAEPDVVFQDLISVFYPAILPNHNLRYFTKMK